MPGISCVNQTGLVILNELKRYVRSKKLFIMFFILAGILFLFSVASVKLPQKMWQDIVKSKNVSQAEIAQLKTAFSSVQRHPNPIIRYISKIPPVNLITFTFSVLLLPLIIFVMGYNAISGEISQRNIQYYLIRVSRMVFFFGKLLANIITVFLIAILANGIILLYAKWKLLDAEFVQVLKYMLLFDGYLLVYSLCYIGFIFFMSSLFKRPPIALLMAFVIPIFAGFLRFFRLGFLLPSSYFQYFYNPDAVIVLKAVLAYIVFAVIFGACSLLIFLRKDLT